MDPQQLTKPQREELIRQVASVTGIAQYALQAKATNEQLIKACENLDVLSIIKAANNFNRYQQGQKTAAANVKIKEVLAETAEVKVQLRSVMQELLDLKNSEIVRLGQWLVTSLAKTGKDRQESLIENGLVESVEYDAAIIGMTGTIKEQQELTRDQISKHTKNIKALETKNDSLRKQLAFIEDYIKAHQGSKVWEDIVKNLRDKAS